MSHRLRIAVRKFPPFELAIRKQWELFEASRRSGFSLELVPLEFLQLEEAMFERDGLRDGSFDIAFLNTARVLSASARNDVIDLTPYLQENPPHEYPSGWSDSMLRLQSMDGCVFGIPYHDGPECLIYRRDLFANSEEQQRFHQQYGVALEPPKTWEDFSRIARYFQRPEQHLYGCAFAAFPDGHNTVYDFLLQLWTRGGELNSEHGEIRLSSLQAAEALTFYRTMVCGGEAVHPDCRNLDSVRCGDAFARGEVAMMVNWFGFAAVAQTSAESRVKGNVHIAPVPSNTSVRSASLNVYWLLSIAAGTPHKDLCYEFIRHCASPEMDKLLTLEGAIGCRKSTWMDAEVNSNIPFYSELERLHETARELPQIAEWTLISNVINDLVRQTIETDRNIEELLRESDVRISSESHLSEGPLS